MTDPRDAVDPTSVPTTEGTPPGYRSTARYLGAAAHAEAERRPPTTTVPTGPQFVRDVMVAGVVAAHEDATFKEIVAALVRNGVGAVPVVDLRRRVLGVVSESDMLARVCGPHLARPRGHLLAGHAEARRKMHATTARELMTSPAVVTTADTAIAVAARQAADSRVHRLPVVDSQGVLVGIVTRADLLRQFLRPDAEIRDDIVRNVVVGSFVLDANSVGVAVDEGVVTLSGELERRAVTQAMIESVRAIAGVVEVEGTGLTHRFEDSEPPGHPLY